MSLIMEYYKLLDEYDVLIRQKKWWDGSREELVRQMDAKLRKMSEAEQNQCEEYSRKLYKKHIGEA